MEAAVAANVSRSGMSTAITSHDSSSTRRTPCHDAVVWVNPGTSTTREPFATPVECVGETGPIAKVWRDERARRDNLVRADARRRMGAQPCDDRGRVAG